MDGPEMGDLLLEYAQDKIVVIDESGTFKYLNRASEQILGYEPAELVGENAFDLIHPDDVEGVRSVFDRTIAAGTEEVITTGEYRMRSKAGSWVWLRSRFSNLTHSKLEGYVVSSQEITDLVRTRRERERTANKLQELTTNTDDVLWMFSGDWSELLFLNEAYEAIYGMPVAEVREEPLRFLEAIHPDDVEKVRNAMERLSAGTAVDIEYRVNPRQNYGRWVWVKSEPVVEDGEVVRIAGFSRDVTDRRRRERQLAVIDNVLRHNLRNDLNTIIGYASLIAEDAEGDTADRTAVIRGTAQGLLAKAQKQRRAIGLLTNPPPRRPIDLNRAVAAAVERVSEEYGTARVRTDLPDELYVDAVPEIEAAVTELVENAVKHATETPAEVRIVGERRGDDVALAVNDECPPIPEYEYRVLTGDREMDDVFHSSGLGLWLVYWAVDLSAGDVEFSAGGDRGNTVTVVLPSADGTGPTSAPG